MTDIEVGGVDPISTASDVVSVSPLLGFRIDEEGDTFKIQITSHYSIVRRTVIAIATPALIAGLFFVVPDLVSKVNPYVVLLSPEEFDLVQSKYPRDIQKAQTFASTLELKASVSAEGNSIKDSRLDKDELYDLRMEQERYRMEHERFRMEHERFRLEMQERDLQRTMDNLDLRRDYSMISNRRTPSTTWSCFC